MLVFVPFFFYFFIYHNLVSSTRLIDKRISDYYSNHPMLHNPATQKQSAVVVLWALRPRRIGRIVLFSSRIVLFSSRIHCSESKIDCTLCLQQLIVLEWDIVCE